MLSEDERFKEDIEQVQYLMDYSERKELRRRERKIKRDSNRAMFKSSAKN